MDVQCYSDRTFRNKTTCTGPKGVCICEDLHIIVLISAFVAAQMVIAQSPHALLPQSTVFDGRLVHFVLSFLSVPLCI